MNYVERDPPVYEAVQFNKEGDYPLVKRGYRFKNHLYATDMLPRSPECSFTWVLSSPHNFEEIKLGNWVVSNSKSAKLEICTDAEFQARFKEKELFPEEETFR